MQHKTDQRDEKRDSVRGVEREWQDDVSMIVTIILLYRNVIGMSNMRSHTAFVWFREVPWASLRR